MHDIIHAETEANLVSEAMARMRSLILRKGPVLMRAGRHTYTPRVQRPRLPKDLRAQLRAELQAGARVCDLCHKYALPRDTVNNIRRELSDSKKNS